jgi:hypothetical protein
MIPIMPCAASPDDSMIMPGPVDPTIRAVVWELAGLNDIKACIDKPLSGNCVMAVVGVTPWGKFKLVSKLGNGLDAVKDARGARRTVACLTGAAHSFPAGTRVLMADGTRRSIEQIEAGDLVTATDPTTGETGARTVTRTIHTPDDRNFTDVALADGSTLTSTTHHPYWSQNDQTWKNAGDLEAGDTLRTPQNTAVVIAATHDWPGLQDAYDLTVDGFHSYYVSTGTTDVLVHNNDNPCPDWVSKAWKKLPKRKSGDPTSGYVFEADGTLVWDSVLTSGRSPLSEDISAFLKGSPDFPNFPGYADVAHHAEAKIAWEMRTKMGKGKKLHIVINTNYVCPKVSSPNSMGCKQAVPAILYEDQTLYVHYPGASDALELKGTAKR